MKYRKIHNAEDLKVLRLNVRSKILNFWQFDLEKKQLIRLRSYVSAMNNLNRQIEPITTAEILKLAPPVNKHERVLVRV